MSLEVAALAAEHEGELRSLLCAEPLRNLRLLDALNDAAERRSQRYGVFSAGRMVAAALVEPFSRRLLPSACAAEHARALGASLAGAIELRSSLGDRVAVEAIAAAWGLSKPRRLFPHRLFTAWADTMGPYLTRALRVANDADCRGLIAMGSAELAEVFESAALERELQTLHAQVQDRVRRQRTWVLELEGKVVTKIDLAARTRFGVELEGLYTAPEHRSRGFATLALGQLSRDLLSSTPRVVLRIANAPNPLLAVARKVGYVSAPVQQLLAVLSR